MSAPRVARGAQLLVQLRELFAELTPTPLVTDDARKLDTAPTLPGIVVLFPAPTLTFPAPGVVLAAWQLAIVAGPADDERRAWQRIDELVEALRGQLPIESAEPGVRPRPDNPVPLPGYTLTIPETLDDYA